jgi:hypothetical protein
MHHAHPRETRSVVGQMHPDWYVSRGQESDGDGAPLAPGPNVRGKSAAMRPSRCPFGWFGQPEGCFSPPKSTLSRLGGPSGAAGQHITRRWWYLFPTQSMGSAPECAITAGSLGSLCGPTLHCYPGRCVSKRVEGHHAHARETGSVVGQMHPDWYVSQAKDPTVMAREPPH